MNRIPPERITLLHPVQHAGGHQWPNLSLSVYFVYCKITSVRDGKYLSSGILPAMHSLGLILYSHTDVWQKIMSCYCNASVSKKSSRPPRPNLHLRCVVPSTPWSIICLDKLSIWPLVYIMKGPKPFVS